MGKLFMIGILLKHGLLHQEQLHLFKITLITICGIWMMKVHTCFQKRHQNNFIQFYSHLFNSIFYESISFIIFIWNNKKKYSFCKQLKKKKKKKKKFFLQKIKKKKKKKKKS